MMRRGKTSWRNVQVFAAANVGGEGEKLDLNERLVALYRLQNREDTRELFYGSLDDGRHAPITDPADIDWDRFPVLAALEAVTFDELRRLRGLLRTDSDFPPAL
jgi:hypothetical protein